MSSLPVASIRQIARESNYHEIQFNEQSRVVAFRNQNSTCRINVYYTTGCVATCLDHPRSGKTQLFRKHIRIEDLELIFRNPRIHTGVGYYYRRRDCGAWSKEGGGGGAECDDARRWRYIANATEFCNGTQANQIAAFCKLWDQLRFMPDGMTSQEQFEACFTSEEEVMEAGILSPPVFCTDGVGGCKCTERAGSWCSLMRTLCTVLHDTEGIVGFFRPPTDEKEMDIKSTQEMSGCQCQAGLLFQQKHSGLLQKLDRQLRSLPRQIRRELMVWYVHKHVGHYEPFSAIQTSEGVAPMLLASECSNAILQCHHDYGILAYSEGSKGCPCHGA